MLKKTVTHIINVIVILAVLAVGFYGYKIISNRVFGNNVSENETVLVTVEFSKYDKDVLKKVQSGDTVMDSLKNEVIGTVKDVSEVKDSVSWVKDYEKGMQVKATTPDFGLMTVTLECPAVITPSTIRINNTEVRIGATLGIRSNSYTLTGTVLGLEF